VVQIQKRQAVAFNHPAGILLAPRAADVPDYKIYPHHRVSQNPAYGFEHGYVLWVCLVRNVGG
jgi:hypothetical protein